jgi:hypothetical protein
MILAVPCDAALPDLSFAVMPPLHRPRLRLTAALLSIPLSLASAAALAQDANAPPSPSLNRAASPLLGFGIMFLLTGAVVAISLMPSKRSHQD